MLCPKCSGSGWLPSIDARVPQPCEACGQLGYVHCCEGACEPAGRCAEAPDVWQEWIEYGGEGGIA